MRRFATACRVRPEKRSEYLRLHAEVWPRVEETITACGIRNFTIFVRGDDYEADQAKMAADPETQRWWSQTDACQLGFDQDAPEGARWQEFDEVWHLD